MEEPILFAMPTFDSCITRNTKHQMSIIQHVIIKACDDDPTTFELSWAPVPHTIDINTSPKERVLSLIYKLDFLIGLNSIYGLELLIR